MIGFMTSTPPLVLHDWLDQRVKIPWSKDFQVLAKVVDNVIVAAVGYEGFTGSSCRMHLAIDEPKAICREFVRTAFRYPFDLLDMPMVFGIAPSGNVDAIALALRLGFKELLYIPGAHPDGGLHLLQLLRDDWKRSKYYGRQIPRST